MKRILSSVPLLLASAACLSAGDQLPSDLKPAVIVSTATEPVAPGKFQPSWESLSQYEAPEWFRDRKFGI
jgi:alpha-L-fucosidase